MGRRDGPVQHGEIILLYLITSAVVDTKDDALVYEISYQITY